MPAQRLKKYKKRKVKGGKTSRLFKLLFTLFSFLGIYFYLLLTTENFDSGGPFALVLPGKEKTILVVVNKKDNKVTYLNLPASIQVEVAQQLGVWKLGSVYQLSSKGGELLTKTLAKNFNFPVSAYVQADISRLKSPLVIFLRKTNLKVGDRVFLLFSLLTTPGDNFTEIDLEDTGYLFEAESLDRERIFKIREKIPSFIAAIFSDEEFNRDFSRVHIIDQTGDFQSAATVASIIEVMGGKPTSIDREKPTAINCYVSGRNARIVHKLSVILDCLVKTDFQAENFDIEISLGEDFARNF